MVGARKAIKSIPKFGRRTTRSITAAPSPARIASSSPAASPSEKANVWSMFSAMRPDPVTIAWRSDHIDASNETSWVSVTAPLSSAYLKAPGELHPHHHLSTNMPQAFAALTKGLSKWFTPVILRIDTRW
jgi:hypothetical protein